MTIFKLRNRPTVRVVVRRNMSESKGKYSDENITTPNIVKAGLKRCMLIRCVVLHLGDLKA
jgi:hypothetical protein